MPSGAREAIMTVCPGNPEQEGRRFRAIMEAAGAKLDRLTIIEAGDLGFHNLKRLVPKNEAAAFARYRGERWVEAHKPAIDEYMAGRCQIVPMREIVDEPTYKDRIELIRQIYDRGDNPVSHWFDYSLGLDIESRAERRAKDGVLIEPWAIRENALDYLCDEYAMRSLMRQRFGLDEIYLGLAIADPDLFQRENPRPEIDLRLPPVRPITLHEVQMVHVEKLGRSVPANDQRVPDYAKDMGTVLAPKMG
ncbi:MAG: hypothetical protein KKC03_13470 [Bacteroidetes bacterium]|nr:hypothetical protein [Bacteroidota bacterium]